MDRLANEARVVSGVLHSLSSDKTGVSNTNISRAALPLEKFKASDILLDYNCFFPVDNWPGCVETSEALQIGLIAICNIDLGSPH